MPKVIFTAAPMTAASSNEGGDFVKRTGKYFEIGRVFTDRSGKRFGLETEAEADAALAQFKPAALNVEHAPSVFDGLLGEVSALRRDGKDIIAEYTIPKWLHDATGGAELPISSEWDSTSKTPLGAALTLKPAVKDAVMTAAFKDGGLTPETALAFAMARHNTPEGQTTMQDLHDMAARAGAVCDRTNTAKMSSAHEAKAIQRIHDIAADHGADCSSGDAPLWIKANYSQPKPPVTPVQPQGEKPMTFWEKIQAIGKKAGVPDNELPTEADLPTQTAHFSESDKARFAAQDAEIARLRAKDAARDGDEFAAKMLSEGRIYPFESDALKAAFSQAITDDAKIGGVVQFSEVGADGKASVKDGSRVEMVKALYAARPPHGMDKELVSSGRSLTEDDFKALFSRSSATETPDEKAARLAAEVAAERKAHGLTAKN